MWKTQEHPQGFVLVLQSRWFPRDLILLPVSTGRVAVSHRVLPGLVGIVSSHGPYMRPCSQPQSSAETKPVDYHGLQLWVLYASPHCGQSSGLSSICFLHLLSPQLKDKFRAKAERLVIL